MKIGIMMQFNPLKHAHNQNFDLLKIQDSGWPPFCKIKKMPFQNAQSCTNLADTAGTQYTLFSVHLHYRSWQIVTLTRLWIFSTVSLKQQ